MIYAFANQKGGVGKTTLSVHLADYLQRQGHKTLLIDADPQGSSLAWSALRQEHTFPVIGLAKATLHKDIIALAADYTHVVIDGPPRLQDIGRSILIAADMVIVPVQPSPYDVWAASNTIDLIKEAIVFKETLKAVIALNRKIAHTAIGRDVRDALQSIGVPVIEADIAQRVVYPESAASGTTVFASRDRKAITELETFLQQLVNHEQKDINASTTSERASGTVG